jgi:DNA-binding transcriptional LysR family regulator
MNIRQIETFYWVVQLGGFAAAAERLNATQSTVSMRVQEIEKDLGVQLFDRSRRAARLTPKGRELMTYAEEMLRLDATIRDRMAGPASLPGIMRLGVAEMISLTWLPRLVKRIHESWPKIRLELDEALTQDLMDRLNQGTLDLVLAPSRAPGHGLDHVSLGLVEFAWMASPTLGLPDRVLGPRDLQDWPVIALARESYHHSSIEEWFRSAGAVCRRIDMCKSLGVAASLAAAGLGLTLLPVDHYRPEVDAGRLRAVATAPLLPKVEFMAMFSADSVMPAARHIAALAAELSDFEKARPQPLRASAA